MEQDGSSPPFDQISIEGAGRVGGQRDQLTSSFPLGGFHVIGVIRRAGEVVLYVDGKLEGTRPVTPATTVMDVLRVGARFYEDTERQYFHGEIAQLALYGRALDDEERMAIEDSLRVSDAERAEGERAVAQLEIERRKNRMIAPKVIETWPTIAAYASDTSAPMDSLPIRTDIREGIELGVRHLNNLYDRDRNDEPYFFVNRQADGTGKMFHSVNIGIPHVVGRCLVACMVAEQAAGVPFPEDGRAILERYCRVSFDNDDHLNSYLDPERGDERLVEFHNMREGLYGLWALIVRRDSAWARETAHAMLVTLDGITDAEGRWSMKLVQKAGAADRWLGLAPSNAARMVDPLLAYYECTGDPLASKLAEKYSKQGLAVLFLDDGRFAPMERSSGHVHSITSSLSGITAYAAHTRDQAMLATCRTIMDVGVPEYFSSWGWGDEVFPEHPADVISRGEINQTGDVVRTALTLGAAGWPEYYEVAERFLRGMILPTQHREPELGKILRDNPAPDDDSERHAVRRSIGGYAMQLPNDRMRSGDWPISTLDITSGAVHAMAECWRQRTTCAEGVYTVNLLFDFEDDAVTITSGLPKAGLIEFAAKKDIRGIHVRMPAWVDAGRVRLVVLGEASPAALSGGYCRIPPMTAGARGALAFDVPCKREKETVDGIEYTTTWVGNQVVDIQPHGVESPLPF